MPVLKIPLSKKVGGMILLDNKRWYSDGCLKKAYNENLASDVLYKMSVLGELERNRIFGINYYRTTALWPDYLRQSPKIEYTFNYECAEFLVNNLFTELRVISPIIPSSEFIFGDRPGMFRSRRNKYTGWIELYNNSEITWTTRGDFMLKNNISSQSTLYREMKTGSIVSMDFLGKKNILFYKTI